MKWSVSFCVTAGAAAYTPWTFSESISKVVEHLGLGIQPSQAVQKEFHIPNPTELTPEYFIIFHPRPVSHLSPVSINDFAGVSIEPATTPDMKKNLMPTDGEILDGDGGEKAFGK